MARLWIDGDLILDHFTQQRVYRERARRVRLHVGELYEVEMEYLEVAGDAFCQFLWSASTGQFGSCRMGAVRPEIATLCPSRLLCVGRPMSGERIRGFFTPPS